MFTSKTTVAILVLAIAAALVYIVPTNAMLHGRTAASGARARRQANGTGM